MHLKENQKANLEVEAVKMVAKIRRMDNLSAAQYLMQHMGMLSNLARENK